MALHRPDHVASGEIFDRDDRGSGGPAGEELVLAIVEAQRKHSKSAVLRAEAEIVSDADRAEPQVGVGQHHPLWTAGGAGRVEKGRKLLRIGRGWWQGAGVGEHRSAFLFVHRGATGRKVAVLEGRQPRGACDKQSCSTVGEDVRHLSPLQKRVDRHVD